MKDKELVSNCCGARVDSLNAENIGICSECKEGCGVEEVEIEEIPGFEGTLEQLDNLLKKKNE